MTQPVVALISKDLMFQSRVGSVVRGAGKAFVPATSMDALAQRCASGNDPQIIVLDLGSTSSGLSESVAAARDRFPGVRLMAYGPHVDLDAFQAAEAAGIESIYTRGQFDRDMATLLAG